MSTAPDIYDIQPQVDAEPPPEPAPHPARNRDSATPASEAAAEYFALLAALANTDTDDEQDLASGVAAVSLADFLAFDDEEDC